jgi:hypothetical protein
MVVEAHTGAFISAALNLGEKTFGETPVPMAGTGS